MQPYYAYLNTLRWEAKIQLFALADRFQVDFFLPVPKSWSGKRRAAMCGEPHQQKPDVNNLSKTLEDALRKDDERVWDVHARKYWSGKGAIEIVNFAEESR